MPTLADIEQEVAARVGPYLRVTASGGSLLGVTVPALRSNAELGGWEGMYLLRRGYLESGAPAAGHQADDRERTVRVYSAINGLLEVDRPWVSAPVEGEVIELHHLSPAYELRPAVQRGLWRCYLVERLTVTLTGSTVERDVTAVAPWLTETSQIYDVAWDYQSGVALPTPVWWWRTFRRDGHVWLQLPSVATSKLLITARRPVATRVNGGDSTTGPTDDQDELDVDLDYAAAAGHVEAWRRCRQRLQLAAQTGMFASQQEAVAEFSRQALAHFRPPARQVRLGVPFGRLGVQIP